MPLRVREYQSTPNPEALKCILDGTPPGVSHAGLRSYASRDAAQGDPLALALLAIPGVRSLLIHAAEAPSEPSWISINKSPGAGWKSIKPALERILEKTDAATTAPTPTPTPSPHAAES